MSGGVFMPILKLALICARAQQDQKHSLQGAHRAAPTRLLSDPLSGPAPGQAQHPGQAGQHLARLWKPLHNAALTRRVCSGGCWGTKEAQGAFQTEAGAEHGMKGDFPAGLLANVGN